MWNLRGSSLSSELVVFVVGVFWILLRRVPRTLCFWFGVLFEFVCEGNVVLTPHAHIPQYMY